MKLEDQIAAFKRDRDAQIAEAESKGDFVLADRLKAEWLRGPRLPSMIPEQREKRIAEIADAVATAEARGDDSRPLRAEWAHLLSDAV